MRKACFCGYLLLGIGLQMNFAQIDVVLVRELPSEPTSSAKEYLSLPQNKVPPIDMLHKLLPSDEAFLKEAVCASQ